MSSPARQLRMELADRACGYAKDRSLPHALTYADHPVVCFEPFGKSFHGNFHPASYRAIRKHPQWGRRLAKVHTTARRSLPAGDHGRRRELDTCTSSDALLMNVLCHPGARRSVPLCALLGVPSGMIPEFGFRARVPFTCGQRDRTEVDARLGDLLVEAKLTENDFQRGNKTRLQNYRDFREVFEADQLPQSGNSYDSAQLIRNVLAAHALECSFCVLLDGRRPDLLAAWYATVRCVKVLDLRLRCKVLTWQELARTLPATLQAFLGAKYGIE